MNKPILLWQDNPPEEIAFDRDDVDYYIAVPPDMGVSWRLKELGGCDNKVYRILSTGFVEREIEFEKWEATEFRVPLTSSFIGFKVIIATHA